MMQVNYYAADDRSFRGRIEASGDTQTRSELNARLAAGELPSEAERRAAIAALPDDESRRVFCSTPLEFRPTAIEVRAEHRILVAGIDSQSAVVAEFELETTPSPRFVPIGEPMRFKEIGILSTGAFLPDSRDDWIALDRQRSMLWRIDLRRRYARMIASTATALQLVTMRGLYVTRLAKGAGVRYHLTEQDSSDDYYNHDLLTLTLLDDDGNGSIDRIEDDEEKEGS